MIRFAALCIGVSFITMSRPCCSQDISPDAIETVEIEERVFYVNEDLIWPSDQWTQCSPEEVGMDESLLADAREYALRGEGSGYITKNGRLVMAWGSPDQRYDLKSTTKSFGSIALGLAIDDGKIQLSDFASKLHPEFGVTPESNRDKGLLTPMRPFEVVRLLEPARPLMAASTSNWLNQITILHLASQTAGFEKPGGYTSLLFEPGKKWDYSDSGPNWLAECVTLAYEQDLQDLMFNRVFTPIGINRSDLTWRNNAYRPSTINGVPRREFGSGIHADVDAMARIGLLMLREGRWRDRRILSEEYVRLAVSTPPGHDELPVLHPGEYGNASAHYGLLWWNNSDGTLENVPRDAYWSWGLYDSLIVVIPSLDIVVARAGKSFPREPDASHYDFLRPFFDPIAASVQSPEDDDSPASRSIDPSPVIRNILWDPPETIVRRAKGSDNWPITHGDDDRLYTAYGDGFGFEPFLSEKLSLGLAVIQGGPDDFIGENLRSPSIEQRGGGASGKKASGILMVNGILYLWLRNADNSQLAWSDDRGLSWNAVEWRFTQSFGCPTFLNFGPDYAGAGDQFVYIYSQDADTAYDRADRMVLARVPQDRILQREEYDFFVNMDESGKPVWTDDLAQRGGVFMNPGVCYRSSVSFNSGINRYLWTQTGRGEDTRFEGGLAVYDAPAPWGPWTLVYQAEPWDVGPGETAGFPTKWMSADGLTLHLVFSGDDCFSVRRCTLQLR